MRTGLVTAAAGLAIGAIVSLHAQQPAPDRFRYERAIVTAGPGPQRLAIDVALLRGAEPFLPPDPRMPSGRVANASGLADLRLFDQNGTQVPYLLVRAPSAQPSWQIGDLLPIARTEKTSGFEADFGAADTIDRIRVAGLPAPFLKRLTLEGSGDRAHWTLLAAEGTLFDLPDEGLRQTEVPFSRGAFRYVRITWNDANSGRVPVPASVEARRVPAAAPPPPLTTPLPVERRPSEPERSRYRIRLPASRLPIVALDLNVSGGNVFRQAIVSESRLSVLDAEPAVLGRARLVRVVRDGVAAGELRIPIASPLEAEIDLVIEDGSNAPLPLTGVTAVFAELPWIYFEAPAGAVTAKYGNRSAAAPTYDLEAVRDAVNLGSLKEATWGEPRALAEPTPVTSATTMPETGARVDPGLFTYARAIPDGPAGLAALPLDAGALTHSRGPASRFADVRIIDALTRQVPYVIERRDEPLAIDLSLQPATAKSAGLQAVPGRNRSTYLVRLPYTNLPGARIVLETSARVFRRNVQLSVERPPDRLRRDPWIDVMAAAAWAHAEQGVPAPALVLPVPPADTTDLLLTVDEGDNSALPLTGVRLLLPSYRLRFYRPAGESLKLVYGRTDLAPPQYDLALLAPQVMGVEAREVTAAGETGGGAGAPASFISPRGFWVFLSIAVLVLLALIMRLARNR